MSSVARKFRKFGADRKHSKVLRKSSEDLSKFQPMTEMRNYQILKEHYCAVLHYIISVTPQLLLFFLWGGGGGGGA